MSFTQSKGQMPAGWIKTSQCKKWEMQMSVGLFLCYGHENRKNNLSSTGISCDKINVWEQGQIEFKITFYKEIIHILHSKYLGPQGQGLTFWGHFYHKQHQGKIPLLGLMLIWYQNSIKQLLNRKRKLQYNLFTFLTYGCKLLELTVSDKKKKRLRTTNP